MGVPSDEEERENVAATARNWSVPQHRVTLEQRFALGKYAVTREEFAAFVRETGHQAANVCSVYELDKADRLFKVRERVGYNWTTPGFAQTGRDPVVCVSWDDAKAYVAWLSKKASQEYRLPSEAEWEYAARAGTLGARFSSDDGSIICRYANVADLTLIAGANAMRGGSTPPSVRRDRIFPCSDGHADTAPVGSFEPNAFGLYDMLGNVAQWAEDCWNRSYHGSPTDGSAWVAGACSRRVVRGGSFVADPSGVRVGARSSEGVGARRAYQGFRVARTLLLIS